MISAFSVPRMRAARSSSLKYPSQLAAKVRSVHIVLRAPPARIITFGAQGSGKGTLGKQLQQEIGATHLSSGDCFRLERDSGTELGKLVVPFMTKGHLVPDKETCEFIDGRLARPDCNRSFNLDGIPRNASQVALLDGILERQKKELTLVIELFASDKTLISRIQKRGRDDDKDPLVVAQRLEIYRNETAPLLDIYRKRGLLVTINAEGSDQEVLKRVMTTCKLTRWESIKSKFIKASS